MNHVTRIELKEELLSAGCSTVWSSLRSEKMSNEEGAGEREDGAGEGVGEGWLAGWVSVVG